MNLFIIVVILLLLLLFILVIFKIYNTPTIKINQIPPSEIPSGSSYQNKNKLPDGWDLNGNNDPFIVTPCQTCGVNY